MDLMTHRTGVPRYDLAWILNATGLTRQNLPQQLHFKLIIALHRDLITKCPLFVEFDNNSILRILTLLRSFTLPPRETSTSCAAC